MNNTHLHPSILKDGPISIGFVLAPNFTLSAFSNFLDAIRLAADDGDLSRPIFFSWDVISHDYQPIKSSCNIKVVPTRTIYDRKHYDYIVVVGGLLQNNQKLPNQSIEFLLEAAKAKTTLIGICTGTFILARAGLLKTSKVCISWFHHDQFINEFPKIKANADSLFTIDNQFITCSGGIGALHLAAHLIERHRGKYEAVQSLRILQSDFPLPAQSLQPPPTTLTSARSAKVKKAILFIEKNIRNPLTVASIASNLNVSTRHLERLFMKELGVSPTRLYLKLRLAHANKLIRQSTYSISYVASECGFIDLSHFCRSFKDEFGITASTAREQYSMHSVRINGVLVQ
ncbi:GlxA family transcriptional regulator [Leeia sp. TBRC 13508]|uniref:GlxA family transcriptional regulator n=1 Tax=Leeia speluncae TaxID=2884804 RepID=A0ABS8DAF8_9NEIS|nr:GlxA family transcriptional regulator [Leeia speluncae]MCB6185117.1 GlxA family transcriptional regulator [Leeia speluncae]